MRHNKKVSRDWTKKITCKNIIMNINKSIKKFKMAFKCHLSNQTIVSMCANIRYLQQQFP